jgi:hypothetical protein
MLVTASNAKHSRSKIETSRRFLDGNRVRRPLAGNVGWMAATISPPSLNTLFGPLE